MKTKNKPIKTKNKPMKISIKNPFLLPLLIAGLGLIPAGRVTAQTLTTLHSFTETSGPTSTNSDGANPWAGLILSGTTLYGTAYYGGSSGKGTVFAVNIFGGGFTTLHSFTNSPDGAYPAAGLVLSGNTLYGTASLGGSVGNNGTVFAVHTDGTGFTNLYNFDDGWDLLAGLILSGNTLYGTTAGGGSGGRGTVFAVHTDGTGFTNLYNFTGGDDGWGPQAGLVLSGNTLYGTTYLGGSPGYGTVFAVNTDGMGFTNLHSFTARDNNGTNSDGVFPLAGLILSGTTLYGTASGGGSANGGTVFAVNTDGTGFTNLYNFTDASEPEAGLILSGNTLYGTTYWGGSEGWGTVFAVNTNGTGFTTLYSFSDSDGSHPQAGLILSVTTLYGTTYEGGSSGNGTVFSLSLLTIIRSGANVVVSWPANVVGFTLQSTTNLNPPIVWSPVSPGPTVVNGQNTVTNPASGTQKFYRLSQ
jgi:uncharacterized repeat protein (TIGR03803 family)